MQLIKELREDKEFILQKERLGVRGIFFDDNGLIPKQYVKKHDIYKFP